VGGDDSFDFDWQSAPVNLSLRLTPSADLFTGVQHKEIVNSSVVQGGRQAQITALRASIH
jgi:hypothetical protein